MTINYKHYCEIRDRACIAYQGRCPECIFLLKLLRPKIETSLPGLTIYLSCEDSIFDVIKDETNVVRFSELDRTHKFFGFVKILQHKTQPPHPLEVLMEDVGISSILTSVAKSNTKLCCIFSEGILPTQNLSDELIQKYKQMANKHGYDVWANPPIESINESGWVIGVEGLPLTIASYNGIKTSLVPTGIGTKLYKRLFPSIEVLKI